MKSIIRIFIITVLFMFAYSLGYANGGNHGLVNAVQKILAHIIGHDNVRVAIKRRRHKDEPNLFVLSLAADDNTAARLDQRYEIYHKTEDDYGTQCNILASVTFSAIGEPQIRVSPLYPPDPVIPPDPIFPPDPICNGGINQLPNG